MSTTEYIVHELGRFLTLLPSYTFMIGCYLLWRITYKISAGHYVIGQFCVLLLFVFDILFTLKPEFSVQIRPYLNACLTTWVFYNVIYFYLYPMPINYLQSDRPVVIENAIPYKPRTKAGLWLLGPVKTRPVWFTTWFRWSVVVVLFLIFCAYFIQRLALMAVESDKRVIEVTSNTARQVEATVEQAVREAVAPLGARQEVILEAAQKAVLTAEQTKKDVNGQFKVLGKKADRAAAKAGRAEKSAERGYRSSIYTPGAPLPPRTESFFLSPDRVKSLPSEPSRRRKPTRPGKNQTGYTKADSTNEGGYYVRRGEWEPE